VPSNSARGSYYRARSKKWLEAQGYTVAYLERMLMVAPGAYVKQDQLGADLLAVRAGITAGVLFVQVKMGGASWRKRGVSEAKKEFEKYPLPDNCLQVIHVWEPGAHEPLVWRQDADRGWQEPALQPALRLGGR
jgi:hypothetical protein